MFVQYTVFGLDPAYRRLPDAERTRAREELADAVRGSELTTYAYGLTGLKAGCDLLLWRLAPTLDRLQESAAAILRTGAGRWLSVVHVLTGLIRASHYVKKQTTQEQGMLAPDRKPYLIVYPFTKTWEWFRLSPETRQGMMNEHMRIGHDFPAVRQLLAYSFGVDDQEWIVAYETEDLRSFQDLVKALRDTEARRHTLRDTPIFVGIHRPLERALDELG